MKGGIDLNYTTGHRFSTGAGSLLAEETQPYDIHYLLGKGIIIHFLPTKISKCSTNNIIKTVTKNSNSPGWIIITADGTEYLVK